VSPRARPDHDFERDLTERLLGSRRLAVVGVGDEEKPRDRLGMEAARKVDALRLEGVTVFLAGVTPESYTGPLRQSRPDRILMFDAADWKAAPGSLRVLEAAQIESTSVSTHSLPLSVVVEYLDAIVKIPTLVVGLQPDFGSSSRSLTAAERRGVQQLASALARARRRAPPKRKTGVTHPSSERRTHPQR